MQEFWGKLLISCCLCPTQTGQLTLLTRLDSLAFGNVSESYTSRSNWDISKSEWWVPGGWTLCLNGSSCLHTCVTCLLYTVLPEKMRLLKWCVSHTREGNGRLNIVCVSLLTVYLYLYFQIWSLGKGLNVKPSSPSWQWQLHTWLQLHGADDPTPLAVHWNTPGIVALGK